MAFDVDSFLGEEQAADEARAIKRTPAAPSLVREPAPKSDAELGLEQGLAEDTSRRLGPVAEKNAPPQFKRAPAEPKLALEPRAQAEDPIRHDPLAAAIVAGIPAAGAGMLAGPALEALGAAPAVARTGASALEGATASELQGGNPATGAVLGAAIPGVPAAAGKVADIAKAGASKVIAGAPARAEARALTALTEDVKQTLKDRITEPRAQARIMKVLADPKVRQAADNPEKLLALSQEGLKTNGEAAAKAYGVLDAASAKGGAPGGMQIVEVTEPLLKLRQAMIDRSEHPTAIATVDRIIDQFRGGLGRDPARPVPSADVRRFLTNQIQKPGFGVGDPLSDPPPARAALQEMSGALKDALDGYARKHGSPEAAETLKSLNDKITAFSLMEKSAAVRAARQPQAPSAFTALTRAAQGHKAEGLGGMIGYGVGGPIGSLVGAGAGHVLAKAPAAVDELLASPAAQQFARAGVPTRVLTPPMHAAIPVVSAIANQDPETAKRELAKLVTQ